VLSRAIQFTQPSKGGFTGPKSSKMQSKKLIGVVAHNENGCFFSPGDTGVLSINHSTKQNKDLASALKSTTKFHPGGEKFHQSQCMKVSLKPD
jgi:hypothetical protein